MRELPRNCPICGEAVWAEKDKQGGWYIRCDECDLMFGHDRIGGTYTKEKYAIMNWNERFEDEQVKWISVKDRLPERGIDVIALPTL